jgi:hypothetical protein
MQDTLQTRPELIEKERIPELKFNKSIPIQQDEKLMEKLLEATKLGNLHRGKVAIIFEDNIGLKKVETTVWATGLNYICLKGGVWLPIANIHRLIIL